MISGMVARQQAWERPESLRKPLAASLLLHATVFSFLALFEWNRARSVIPWGSPTGSSGSAVPITPVSRIPLPGRQGPIQPVANDTPSRVPAPPKPVPARAQPKAEDQEEGVAIRGRVTRRTPTSTASTALTPSRTRSTASEQPSQLYSSSGAAVSSPLYGATSGGGGEGVGVGSNPFGNRFGYYVELLRQRVASNWDTSTVDPRLRTAPPVILTFEILRDGQVRNLRFLQRSGHPDLDYSAQRAILQSSPFPPLPSGFERDYVTIEFWFQLRR